MNSRCVCVCVCVWVPAYTVHAYSNLCVGCMEVCSLPKKPNVTTRDYSRFMNALFYSKFLFFYMYSFIFNQEGGPDGPGPPSPESLWTQTCWTQALCVNSPKARTVLKSALFFVKDRICGLRAETPDTFTFFLVLWSATARIYALG